MQHYRTDKFPTLAVFCVKLNEHVVMNLARSVTSRPQSFLGEFAPVEGQGALVGTDPD